MEFFGNAAAPSNIPLQDGMMDHRVIFDSHYYTGYVLVLMFGCILHREVLPTEVTGHGPYNSWVGIF